MAVAAADDLYSLLGVPASASPRQIAEARRRLMRTWHPDLNPSPDALAKSKAINRAADILLDPVQRRDYDEYRLRVAQPETHRKRARPAATPPPWTPPPIPNPPFWPEGVDVDVVRWVWWHTRTLDLYYYKFAHTIDPNDPAVRRAFEKRLHRTLDPKWRAWHIVYHVFDHLWLWAFVGVAGAFVGGFVGVLFGAGSVNVLALVFAVAALVGWGRLIVWPELRWRVMDEIRLPRREVP